MGASVDAGASVGSTEGNGLQPGFWNESNVDEERGPDLSTMVGGQVL